MLQVNLILDILQRTYRFVSCSCLEVLYRIAPGRRQLDRAIIRKQARLQVRIEFVGLLCEGYFDFWFLGIRVEGLRDFLHSHVLMRAALHLLHVIFINVWRRFDH